MLALTWGSKSPCTCEHNLLHESMAAARLASPDSTRHPQTQVCHPQTQALTVTHGTDSCLSMSVLCCLNMYTSKIQLTSGDGWRFWLFKKRYHQSDRIRTAHTWCTIGPSFSFHPWAMACNPSSPSCRLRWLPSWSPKGVAFLYSLLWWLKLAQCCRLKAWWWIALKP